MMNLMAFSELILLLLIKKISNKMRSNPKDKTVMERVNSNLDIGLMMLELSLLGSGGGLLSTFVESWAIDRKVNKDDANRKAKIESILLAILTGF